MSNALCSSSAVLIRVSISSNTTATLFYRTRQNVSGAPSHAFSCLILLFTFSFSSQRTLNIVYETNSYSLRQNFLSPPLLLTFDSSSRSREWSNWISFFRRPYIKQYQESLYSLVRIQMKWYIFRTRRVSYYDYGLVLLTFWTVIILTSVLYIYIHSVLRRYYRLKLHE